MQKRKVTEFFGVFVLQSTNYCHVAALFPFEVTSFSLKILRNINFESIIKRNYYRLEVQILINTDKCSVRTLDLPLNSGDVKLFSAGQRCLTISLRQICTLIQRMITNENSNTKSHRQLFVGKIHIRFFNSFKYGDDL